MKRCPQCRRDYFDDSLLYCLDDGTPLLDGPSSSPGPVEPQTAILEETSPPNEAPTRAQIHTTNIPSLAQGKVPASRSLRGKIVIAAAILVAFGVVGYFGFFARRASAQIDSIA